MKYKIGDKVYIQKINKVEVISIILGDSILVGNNSYNNPLYCEVFCQDDLIPVVEYRKKKIEGLLN